MRLDPAELALSLPIDETAKKVMGSILIAGHHMLRLCQTDGSREFSYQADVLVMLGGQARPAQVEGHADGERAQVPATDLSIRQDNES